jgi:8-oxo-dGTP pyrophosphatase MutT (NUDIX family)
MDGPTREIVVGVVHDGKKVLIMERSNDETFDPKKWEFVSGLIAGDDLTAQAVAQVKEETGLTTRLVKVGKTFEMKDMYGTWIIHPFLFKPESDHVKLTKSHTGYAWIEPSKLSRYDCVKDLEKNLTALSLSLS